MVSQPVSDIKFFFKCNFSAYATSKLMMESKTDRERRFIELTDQYKEIIAKVCYLYTSSSVSFDDLYQETLINIWQGMESFRGEARISTWIYRTAINTCITWLRRNSRHTKGAVPLESMIAEPSETQDQSLADEYRQMYLMISRLDPLEKAVITLWLDEKPYDEIAAVTGLSRSNVAVKVHRIKDKLARLAGDLHL